MKTGSILRKQMQGTTLGSTPIKTTLDYTSTTQKGEEIISMTHPVFGELQLRITGKGNVKLLADSSFTFDFASGFGRIVKVDYFGYPKD